MYWQMFKMFLKNFSIKQDFRNIHQDMKSRTNGKLPTWVIVIYYVIMFPIGMLMLPFTPLIAKIVVHFRMKKITKICMQELEAE